MLAFMASAWMIVPLAVSDALTTQDILIGPESQTPKAYDTLPKPAATYSPAETVGKVLNLFFGFIAILAVSFIMYGGFLWVTSGGVQDKAKKEQGLLVDAAVGLAVLGMVWALSWLIIKTLAEKIIAR